MHKISDISIETDILAENRKLAHENHQRLRSNGVRSLDVMGSIGSGKTLLIQKMALEMNPTLQGMKKMIEAKEKAYALAKREYYPDFNFKFAYGQRDSTPSGMSRMNMLTGMVEVNIPIFYKSKQDRKVAETKADIQVAEAQYRAMKNEVLFMITDMVSMVQRSERQINLYRTGILPQTSLQINSAMSAYRVNKADFMTLLDSQMTLYKYELEYHQALTEYEKNVAGLGATIGKQLLEKGEGK